MAVETRRKKDTKQNDRTKQNARAKQNNKAKQSWKGKQNGKVRRINNTMSTKLVGLFIAVLLALLCLILRITVINATNGRKYTKTVLSQAQQQYNSRVLPAKRGDILDRNGNLLATSNKVYNLVLDCLAVNTEIGDQQPYQQPTVRALEEIMGIDDSVVWGLLNSENTKSSQYEILKKEVTVAEKEAWDTYLDTSDFPEDPKEYTQQQKDILNTKGIWFEESYLRSYPYASLACDTIGFTYNHDTADMGIEGYYNSTLLGIDGRKYGYFNEAADVEQTIIEPVPGNSVVTTLDLGLQQIVEKYVSAFQEALGAANVGVIIEDPSTGEILAMDGGDRYDLNDPNDLSMEYTESEIEHMTDAETVEALTGLWSNFCISNSYEPGSVVKPVVMAGALEKGIITESDHFFCDGGETFGSLKDDYIKCWVYPGGHLDETLGDVIAYSCNDGMMQIGALMGADQMMKTQNLFNFGSRTGIDLPNESPGIIWELEDIGPTELATSTMGQGFTCTMIQEMNALCSVINGGYYYQPHVVSEIRDSRGSVVKKMGATLLKQTISSTISADIRDYMYGCIDYGTGEMAKVRGYSMGGKTGTAEKFPRGNGKYLVSFIGFAPYENPKVAIYVVVDEVNAFVQDSSSYAMYIAQGILSEALPYLNIQADEIEDGYVPQTILWKGFEGHVRESSLNITMDANGFFTDANGHMVDADGNRIDAQGYLLNSYGDYILDEFGEKKKTDAAIQANMDIKEELAADNDYPAPPEDTSTGEYNYYNMESYGLTNEEAGWE